MQNRQVSGILVPLVLVCAGIVLLLNTLQVVTWDIWSQISRYWPILVILFALNLLWHNIRNR